MILSYNWLKELTGVSLPPRELADMLTRAGLNVEEVTPVAGGDFSLNADITTNRPDWLCHQGVAREIAAIQRRVVSFHEPVLNETGPAVETLTSVTPEPGTEEACPRYTLRVIRGVKVGPSPDWVRQRLEAIGQRSINNVVDVTNLVCFEMNQPLHAFDMDKIAGGRIVLRMAKEGEDFAAITGEKSTLLSDMLVIADAEKAVAIGGVKGGQNTEVGGGTVNVLLESAWFQPRSVRRTARRVKMVSESSYRYERGIDPGMAARASARAAELILELAGGELAAGVVDTNPSFGQPWNVDMRFARCDQLIGTQILRDESTSILLGLGLEKVGGDTAHVVMRVPSFRQDLKREVDLIEEVIRLAGYDRIPETITMPLALAHETPQTRAERIIRRTLASLGYHECITDAFVPAEWRDSFAADAEQFHIRNPINAQRPVMRSSLIPSLLEVRRTNRLLEDVRLFEIGRVYRKAGVGARPEEPDRLAILDDRGEEYVRGAVEEVVKALSIDGAPTVAADDSRIGFATGSGAAMRLGDAVFARYGIVSKAERERFDLVAAPAVAEVEMEDVAAAPVKERAYVPLPRYPGVRRDISVSVPEAIQWSSVEAIARRSADMLESLAFESLYRGKGLKAGHKGIAFSMLLRASGRSLTDADANQVRDKVAAALLAEIPEAELR